MPLELPNSQCNGHWYMKVDISRALLSEVFTILHTHLFTGLYYHKFCGELFQCANHNLGSHTVQCTFSYSNSSNATILKKLCKSKKTCQITEWSYGKTLCRSLVIISVWPLCDLTSFFDLQSFLMMVALLLLLYENEYSWWHTFADKWKKLSNWLTWYVFIKCQEP